MEMKQQKRDSPPSPTMIRKRKLAEHSITEDKAILLTNKVLSKLSDNSTFFQQNSSAQLPSFSVDEVTLGSLLGSGAFGEVLEVNNLLIKDNCTCFNCSHDISNGDDAMTDAEDTPYHSNNLTTVSDQSFHLFNTGNVLRLDPILNDDDGDRVTLATEEFDDISDYGQNDDVFSDYQRRADDDGMALTTAEQRAYMKSHSVRHGVARFVVKRQHHKRDDNSNSKAKYAMVDLACEAKFLASLSHPNIIKIRATVGTMGHPDFMMILDRFQMTLEQKMDEWKRDQQAYRGGKLGFARRQKKNLRQLMLKRVVVLRDIAGAMKYLHDNKIMYRDLKPDNIAFDFDSDVKIFDFGLARELKPKDLVNPPNGYALTGLAGSRRYMAPEVVKCKPYGLSADVYSFSMLSWQVFALKTPFANFDVNKHFDVVVQKGKRPNLRSTCSSPSMQSMMEESWADDPERRPTFQKIYQLLQGEVLTMKSASRSSNRKKNAFSKNSFAMHPTLLAILES